MDDKPLFEGQIISHYRILEQLGRGGMGVVYKAEDTRLRRLVALKFLPDGVAKVDGALARFWREAHAASALNHPNICTVYDIGTELDHPYIAMKFLVGEILQKILATRRVEVEDILTIGRETADALSAAHSKGIVHRDIKPGNILINDYGRTKVLDFGLAKMVDVSLETGELTTMSVTQPGLILGTLPYMSPEQLQGRAVGGQSDIFSLGTVLYEMAAGRRPFVGETAAEIISGIMRDRPMPVIDIRAEIPTGLHRIIERCLAKEPDSRYASAEALRDALENLHAEMAHGRPQAPIVPIGAHKSIAVMPFANMSADPENEFFADGVSEEIINALARIEGLYVAARTSAFSFKGRNVDLRTMGERLNVATVLEGGIRKAGERVRITVRLISVADGFHLWSERYDREMKDIFDVQEEIARSIVDRLRISLKGDGRLQPLLKAGTTNPEAYQLYVKGRALLYERGATIPRALECLKRAIALDGNYSMAWAGLAEAFTLLSVYGLASPQVTLPQLKGAATQAFALDPSLSEANSAMACVSLFCDWDFAKTERQLLKAIELNPRNFQARNWYGYFFLQMVAGRFEEGVAQAQQAMETDPLSSYTNVMLSQAQAIAGHYPEAERAIEKALDLDPTAFQPRWCHMNLLYFQDRFEEAMEAAEKLISMFGRHPLVTANIACIYADWGKIDKARNIQSELISLAETQYVSPGLLGVSSSAAGDIDQAIVYMQTAFDIRDPLLIVGRNWPTTRRLRQDERFSKILRDMKLL